MNKKEKLQMERLERLLEAERERAEKVWVAYRDSLYRLVEVEIKLKEVEDAINRGVNDE